MNGFIIIDKPEGITSFKVVSEVRKCLSIRKVGHMGTLDPMASGVLPIMVGTATKALDLMDNHNKKYIAKMKLGISTDTQDTTGKILEVYDKKICYDEFMKVANEFQGELKQMPPMYSAIKKNGVKLYDLARQGKIIDRDARKIFINDLDVIDFDENNQEITIVVTCSRGTYIRSICADIGEKLGTGAAMSYLRRIQSNGFNINDSLSLLEFKTLCENGLIYDKVISIDKVFRNLKIVKITKKQAMRFINGGSLMLSRIEGLEKIENSLKVSVYYKQIFVGLGMVDLDKCELSIVKVFNKNIGDAEDI